MQQQKNNSLQPQQILPTVLYMRTKDGCFVPINITIADGQSLDFGGHKKDEEERPQEEVSPQQIMNGFDKWLRNENSYSECTCKLYNEGAKDFFIHHHFSELSTETVKEYKAILESEGKKPQTVNARINAISALAKYLGKSIKVKATKIQRTLSLEDIPSEEEVGRLLEYCKTHGKEKLYIWIRLLSTTGARVHEFQKFTYEMVAAGSVDLKGKGNKVRRFFFTESVRQECAEYARKNNLQGIIARNRYGQPCTSRCISAELKIQAKGAGINPYKIYPHAFRHYFAKMYLKRNNNLIDLANILGHSNLDITRIYLQNTKEEQEASFAKNVDW